MLGGLLFTLSLPEPLFRAPQSAVLYDAEGILLSARVARDGQWRFPASPRVPEKFARALLAFEDRRFWLHPGFDPASMLRAMVDNALSGKVVSGASTIPMQVVRLALGNQERTWYQKIHEIYLSFRLGFSWSKEEILGLFASNAPFGGNVVGLEAASWRYFGRKPEDLSWAEAATLAVLPNNPSLVHPGKNRERLLERRNVLLKRLWQDGAFDSSSLDLALAEPLPLRPLDLPQSGTHALAWLEKQAIPGQFHSTLHRDLQRSLQDMVNRYQARLEGNQIRNAAVLVLETRTGKIRAWVGNAVRGRGPEAQEFVDMVTAPRSTGSLLKPFLYAAQLDAGETLPEQLVLDIPTRVGSYIPENNIRNYSGALPAAQALTQSLNIPAIRQLRLYGVERFHYLLQRLGMSTLFRKGEDYGLPLVLGGAEGTMLELASLYAGMGRLVLEPSKYQEESAFFPAQLVESGSSALPRASSSNRSPLSPGAAWLTLETLLEVNRPDEQGSWRLFDSSTKIAWKTGTSFGYRDAWAIGVNPAWTVAVWCGNASGEGRPDLKGFATAAPLLFQVFNYLPWSPWFSEPEAWLEEVEVCASSGYIPGPDCADTKVVQAPRGMTRSSICPWCRTVHLNSEGTAQVRADTYPLDQIQSQKRMVLPPSVEYWYRKKVGSYQVLPPWDPASRPSTGEQSINLLYPESGASILIPRLVDGSQGFTLAQAAHRDPEAELFWHLDDEYLGSTREYHHMEFQAGVGKHQLTIVDQKGERVTRWFNIVRN